MTNFLSQARGPHLRAESKFVKTNWYVQVDFCPFRGPDAPFALRRYYHDGRAEAPLRIPLTAALSTSGFQFFGDFEHLGHAVPVWFSLRVRGIQHDQGVSFEEQDYDSTH